MIKDTTMSERYQIWCDFLEGGQPTLVNSYSRPEVAQKALLALTNPGSFVHQAWIVDTEQMGVGVSEEWLREHQNNPRYHGVRKAT